MKMSEDKIRMIKHMLEMVSADDVRLHDSIARCGMVPNALMQMHTLARTKRDGEVIFADFNDVTVIMFNGRME